MKLENLLDGMAGAVSGRRVYGKPIERDGVTVIPAAVVAGGGGAGSQNGQPANGDSSGGGFGIYAFPVGAYVIKDGRVRWKPAVDVGWMTIFALMALRMLLRHRRLTANGANGGGPLLVRLLNGRLIANGTNGGGPLLLDRLRNGRH